MKEFLVCDADGPIVVVIGRVPYKKVYLFMKK